MFLGITCGLEFTGVVGLHGLYCFRGFVGRQREDIGLSPDCTDCTDGHIELTS